MFLLIQSARIDYSTEKKNIFFCYYDKCIFVNCDHHSYELIKNDRCLFVSHYSTTI